jgi:hypothetical protein
MTVTTTSAYTRAHTAKFLSDKMRNLLKYLIQHYDLCPVKLVDAWTGWVDKAARSWLETGHLEKFVIPIRYDGNGADDMWVDQDFYIGAFAKSQTPPRNAIYRILLQPKRGAPDVGLADAQYLALGGLVAREAGTAIATPDLMASMTYYR